MWLHLVGRGFTHTCFGPSLPPSFRHAKPSTFQSPAQTLMPDPIKTPDPSTLKTIPKLACWNRRWRVHLKAQAKHPLSRTSTRLVSISLIICFSLRWCSYFTCFRQEGKWKKIIMLKKIKKSHAYPGSFTPYAMSSSLDCNNCEHISFSFCSLFSLSNLT